MQLPNLPDAWIFPDQIIHAPYFQRDFKNLVSTFEW